MRAKTASSVRHKAGPALTRFRLAAEKGAQGSRLQVSGLDSNPVLLGFVALRILDRLAEEARR
jgi:hypothetical protein